MTRRRKFGSASKCPAERSETDSAGALSAGRRFSTNSTSTARPTTAKQKLMTKIGLKCAGPREPAGRTPAAARASRPRCRARGARRTPCASSSCGVLSEISASRGAVRIPLPVRSMRMIATRNAPRCADHQEQRLADRREPVAQHRDLFVPAPAIADESARDPHQRRRPLVEAVDEAELQRGEPERVDEIERQDRRHHLRRDVREETRHAEQQHRPVDARPQAANAAPAARQDCTNVLSLIHDARLAIGPSASIRHRIAAAARPPDDGSSRSRDPSCRNEHNPTFEKGSMVASWGVGRGFPSVRTPGGFQRERPARTPLRRLRAAPHPGPVRGPGCRAAPVGSVLFQDGVARRPPSSAPSRRAGGWGHRTSTTISVLFSGSRNQKIGGTGSPKRLTAASTSTPRSCRCAW